MRRGDIYFADLGEPIGHEQGLHRPVLIVSAPQWIDSKPPVLAVLPLTRSHRRRATHVEIEPGSSGLKDISYVKCEDIHSISPLRLSKHFGQAEESVMVQVDLILRRLLAL